MRLPFPWPYRGFRAFSLLTAMAWGLGCGATVQAQSLTAAEYFWDIEPAPGSGIVVAWSASPAGALGQEDIPQLNVAVDSLDAGMHQLGFRARDSDGVWGQTTWLPVEVADTAGILAAVSQWPDDAEAQRLVAAEYFWDADPGAGAGTTINGPTAEAFVLGQGGVAALDVNVSALAAGMHLLGWRSKDQAGRWSEVSWLPVEVQSATELIAGVQQWPGNEADKRLVAAEYFWDEDPGRGKGTAVDWTAVDAAVLGAGGIPSLELDATALANGTHRLGYRVRSAAGTWSSTVWFGVQVETGFTRLNVLPAGTGMAGAAAVAWPDVDGDGHPDLFLTGNGPDSANVLLRNNGDGTFASFAGETAALDPVLEGPPGTAWADFDNDGRIDAFLPSAKDALSNPGRLVRNTGSGLSTVTSAALNALSGRWFGGAWADYDRDGRVDLFLPNFVGSGGNRLLRNLSNGFSDVTPTALGQELVGARQAAWVDFDNDGDADLLVTSDAAVGNALFRNDGAAGFTRMPGFAGFTGRGIAWSDFDNDGWLDVVVGANGSPAARLFRNRGDGGFSEVMLHGLVGTSGTEVMPAWLDFDADGWLDLLVPTTGGAVLLRNDRQGSFDSSAVTQSLQSPDAAKPVAAAVADFNGDGFPDVFVAQDAVRAGWLFQNPGTTNHWLKVRLQSDLSNGSAIGARIEVSATIGGTNLTQTRVISGGDGGSQSALEALFGLGDAALANEIRVKWPSGITRTRVLVDSKQAIMVTELPETPEISEQPLDTVVTAGSTLSLNVRAIGRGNLAYQWLRNGQPLPGATNAMLTRTNIHPVQSGDYTVVVNNAAGSVTSRTANVQIDPLFQFTQQLGNPFATNALNSTEINWVDFDRDGDLDLFQVVRHGASAFGVNRLYRNDGSAGFVAVNAGALTQDAALWNSAAWGDFDGDGDLDVAVCIAGGGTPVVFRQDADHTFVRLSDPVLAAATGSHNWISWVDYDRDGHLDLLLVRDGGLDDIPENRRPPLLFRGDDAGGFTLSPALAAHSPAGNYAGAWGDYDDDGLPDLYLTNEEQVPPVLLRNRGIEGFGQDATGAIVTEDSRSSAAAWADYDNDGDLDLAVGNYDLFTATTPVLLYRNEGGGAFSRAPQEDFPRYPGRVFGLNWGDFDNDGDLDLYVAWDRENSDLLYRNNGDGTFDRLHLGFVSFGGSSISPSWADYDGDGRLDLAVARAEGPIFQFRNESQGLGNWLQVRCVDVMGVESLGAKVRVTASIDGVVVSQRRDLNGGGYRSTEPLRAHFGLGDATNVATLKIEWPRSGVQTLTNVAVNRLLTVDEEPDAPFIARQPRDFTAPAGTNLVLEAVVVGAAPMSLQWFRNGQPMPGATNATLSLTNAKPVQSGEFQLFAGNPAGAATSAPVKVEIQWQSRLITASAGALTGSGGTSTGIAAEDFDADGWPDVFVSNFGSNNLLFRNQSGTNLALVAGAPSESVNNSQSAAWGDFDNDGWPDLALVSPGPWGSILAVYRNQEGTGFTRLPNSAVANVQPSGSSVLWADLDRDGWVDLLVPQPNGGAVIVLRNLRDGSFSDVSAQAALGFVNDSLTAGDADGDGFPDLFGRAGGDGQQRLFRNLGGFQFAALSSTGVPTEPGVLAWGDFNNDGRPDVFGARADGFTRLFLSNGDGTFVHHPSPGSDSVPGPSATAAVADFNQDGWLDVAVTYESGGGVRLFQNQGDATFRVIEAVAPAANRFIGAAWADVDRNGAPDLVVAGFDEANELLLRNPGSGANWLTVKLKGLVSNRSAIGAKVRVRAIADGRDFWQLREIPGGGGYASQNELSQHFGLGDATNVITLRIEWPSGRVTEMTDVAVNQFLTVEELPEGTPVVEINGNYSLTERHEFLSHDPVTVTIRSSLPNVFFTTDGTPADFLSTPYTGSFTVTPGTVLHAIAYSDDFAVERTAAPVDVVFLPSFTLTDITPGGGGVVFDPPAGPYASNRVVRVIATNAPGWSFLRWEGDLSGNNPSNALTMDSPKSIRAVFGTQLTTAVTGGAANGSVALDPTNSVVPYGDTSRLMAIPAAAKYFLRWALAGNPITTLTNSPLALTVTNPTPSVTALFGNLPAGNRSLTLRVEGAGTIARNPAAAFYANNSSVTLTAVPEPGWTLDGWAGDLTGSVNPQVVTFDTNKSVIARFRYTGVVDPPVIVAEPSDAARIVGQSVSFTVGVTGSAPLIYQWYFGSQPIDAASLASLTLGPLSLGQSGGYSVVISNPIGAITSRVAQLTVSPPPNIPPSVAWIAPSASAFFRSPTNIVLEATASDSDGSVQRVEFLRDNVILGAAVSGGPNYSFTWTNAPAGTHLLTARAVDNQNATALSASVELVVLPPLVTSFAWEYAAYSETERDGVLRLKVIKSGTGAGSVFFETASRDAVARKDFLHVSAILDFTGLETEKWVEVPLINEYMPDGSKVFEVRLRDASPGTIIGFPSVTEVTLLDDDGPLENSSFLGFFPSSSRPGLPGQLQLRTEPLVAAGQWRLPWDAGWRNSAETVTNLDPGPYTVEYRPAAGYLAPSASEHLVFPNAVTRATNFYAVDPLQGVGTLRVDLAPLAALQGDGVPEWRLVGDGVWLASGQVRSNIAPGAQAIEFRPVDGWATPGSLTVLVQAQVDSSFSIEYRRAGSPPVGAAPPASLPSYDEIRAGQQLSQRRPYTMSGQIRTPAGWASGVAVRDRVVLTAAHVLFDGVTNLVDPTSIEWFHERHAGVAGYTPRPIRAKGYYYLTNYLAARTLESQQPGWIPGSSTPASQEWDVAVLFFDEPVARGGQSGYLLSDATPNLWLGSSREKELIGYPITGANDGRMNTTRAGNYTFGLVPGSTRVYASSAFFSHPGNSGGPLCVLLDRAPVGSLPDPIFFPAAVYLGNYDGQSIVRAIDSVAASLINRAASSAQTGENFLEGGPFRGAPILGGLARFGQIRVRLQPDAVRAAAAGWRFTNTMEYLPDGQAITLPAGPVRLEFKPLAGFRTPAPRDLSIVANLTNEVSVFYEPYGLSFPPIADRVIAEGTPLSIVLGATHEAVPPPPLTYRVVGDLPAGSGVTNGVFGWVPDEMQGPSTNEVQVAVSDGVLGVTNSFTVIVTEVNVAPVLAAVADQVVDEGTALNLTLGATDADRPTNTLSFVLVSGPAGVSVSTLGSLAWTPGELQGPSTNTVVVRVTDNGVPPLSATQQFTILVREVDTAPAFVGLTNATVPELALYTQTLAGTDPDMPAQTLTFSLVSGPAGSGVTNGVFGWVPEEMQGPSTNEVRVAVSDGVLGVTNSFTVIVTEVNVAPVLAAVADQVVDEGTALNLTLGATDDDLPVQDLIFNRVSGPEGLAVSATGIVTWIPTTAQRPSTNNVTLQVTDGMATVTGSFRVIAAGGLVITESALLSGITLLESGLLRLDVSGTAGVRYVIESSPDLSLWTPVFTNVAPFQFTMPVAAQDGGAYLRAVSR